MKAHQYLRIVLGLLAGIGAGNAAKECGGNPADVIFVLDSSTSIWGPNFDKQLIFVQDVIAEFDVRPSKTRCGLLTFSDYVRVEFNLGTFTDARTLKYAVSRIDQLQGATRTDLALLRMLDMFSTEQRRGVPKLAIVLTDGESVSTDVTAAVSNLVHEAGIAVFSIGIGSAVNVDELQNIASSNEYVFEVDTFDALDEIRDILAIKACRVDEGEQADGLPPTPPTKGCDGKPADVVFALDASSSIWPQDFEKQMSFVKDVVSIFEISSEATRIGILTFGDVVESQFYLHKYTDPEKLVRAIGHVRQNSGNTNTAAAIHTMRRRYFSKKRAREGVVHIGVVMTDGQSDDPVATADEARLARKDGIHMFAIGIGRNVDQRELYNIASEPTGQHVFEVSTYDALDSIKNLLAMKTCEVTEPPTTAKPTTTVPPPSGCSAQLPADIIFALPGDATVSQSNRVLKFIGNVTRSLDIDNDAVRFGLVPKHCYTVPGFDLSTGGASRDDVINMISSSATHNKLTNSIIEHMCDISFQPMRGSREHATKIGVVFVSTEHGTDLLEQTTREAAEARLKHGVEFIIVGVGPGSTQQDVDRLIAAHSLGNIVTVPDYDDLRNVAGAMTRRFDDLCLESSHLQLYHL